MAISFQSAILVYAVGCRADGHNCFSCDIVFKVVFTASYILKIDELWHTQSLLYMQVLLYVAANVLFLPFLPNRLETFSGKMVSLLWQSSCINVASVRKEATLVQLEMGCLLDCEITCCLQFLWGCSLIQSLTMIAFFNLILKQ